MDACDTITDTLYSVGVLQSISDDLDGILAKLHGGDLLASEEDGEGNSARSPHKLDELVVLQEVPVTEVVFDLFSNILEDFCKGEKLGPHFLVISVVRPRAGLRKHGFPVLTEGAESAYHGGWRASEAWSAGTL